MPELSDPNVYTTDTTKLMKDAFNEAWFRVKLVDQSRERTRRLLARAIIDEINAGIRDRDKIIADAVATVALTRNVPRVV